MTPAAGRRFTRIDTWLVVLFAVFVGRVWLMVLPSSLWVDELVTYFVVRHPGDPSFAVAPQVPQSIYYWMPKLAVALLGSSEWVLRLPSMLAAGAALFFIARLAARLVHPLAAWFAIFACLAFRSFDYFALDARPYALGMAIASASLLFLIRWFDSARWLDELIFVILAASLWRVHLFYWPFYLVYAVYAAIRLVRRDTPVKTAQIVAAVVSIAAALLPVAVTALQIAKGAGSHAFNPRPSFKNLFYLLHVNVILLCLAAGWVLKQLLWSRRKDLLPPGPDGVGLGVILCWWVICPVSLFVYSRATGNGVLIMRYVSLMLPGIALATAAVAGLFLPSSWWKPGGLAVGVVALALLGQWTALWPAHEADNWRGAASLERSVAFEDTPVICPSPFVEAQSPVWTPEYRLPGFLYAHLGYYPLKGRPVLFPFSPSPESQDYAFQVLRSELIPSGRFVLYGSTWSLRTLDRWLGAQPELASWHKDWKRFDAISVIVYQGRNNMAQFDKSAPRDIP